jgi:ATP-dependent protease ClpP protease subunit
MKSVAWFLLVAVFLSADCLFADTFTNTENSEKFHGYLTGREEAGLSEVFAGEKGLIKINLNNYKVVRNRTGRNNTIALFEFSGEIATALETKAFEDSIQQAVSNGPLFVIIEIDSPGGSINLAKRMCSAIHKAANCCDVYAYINGGETSGAYSAAAAVSLACNKIFMSPGTVIGAATVIAFDEDGKPVELKEVLGEEIGEKHRSGWRNYLASLAEDNNRPGILAKAMENKEIEAIEVVQNGKRVFIDAADKNSDQTLVKIWSKKGSLLTLTAQEAADCGMADKIYGSRQDFLNDANAVSAQILPDTSMAQARQLYDKIERNLKKMDASFDLGLKRLGAAQSPGQAMKAMKDMMTEARFLLGLKKKFGDDIPVDEKRVQEFLNIVQAKYESLRVMRYENR